MIIPYYVQNFEYVLYNVSVCLSVFVRMFVCSSVFMCVHMSVYLYTYILWVCVRMFVCVSKYLLLYCVESTAISLELMILLDPLQYYYDGSGWMMTYLQ